VNSQTPLGGSTDALGSKAHGKETSSSSNASAGVESEAAGESQGKPPGKKLRASSAGSPRESEDSYDIVGTKSGNASGTERATPNLATVKEKEKKDEEEEEEEEDEEDDDDDDEEEEEEDSDWE
jgi:hypothetical protein